MTAADPSRHIRKPPAFMLIELAVACFVIGTSLLALLAVARAGQRAAAEGENETQAMLFAHDAFTTLHLFSERAADDEERATWTNFWTTLATGGSITQFPGFVVSEDPPYKWGEEEGPPTLCGDDRIRTNIWRATAMEDDALPETALQYKMSVSVIPFRSDGEAPPDFQRVQVTLHVWNGSTRIHPETYTFFRVFSNRGRFP